LAPEAFRSQGLASYPSASEGAPIAELQGLSYAPPVGSRGMIAAIDPRSSGPKPHETALPGLDHGSGEAGPGDVESVRRPAVDLHAALGDQPPRLARRRHAEVLHEHGGEVDRVAVRERRLGHVYRRLVFTHDAGEVLLPRPGRVGAVPPGDDPARELE